MATKHGLNIVEIVDGPRTTRTVSTAIIGLVATAPLADADDFPLNTPVRVTDLEAAIVAAGATGTLAGALRAIADHGRFVVVTVRVAPGADAEATEDNVVAGVNKLLTAENAVGSRPRIIGAPGLDTAAVAAALAAVAPKLKARAYAYANGVDLAAAAAYRETFGARELMLLRPDFRVGNATSFAVARALGLRAKIDNEVGVHKTLSNMAIAGVTGLTEAISFDIGSDATEAGQLNDADITTAIQMNGFRFWGNRTCSDEPEYAFESAVGVNYLIQDTVLGAMAWAVDKPLSPFLARDIVEQINDRMRFFKSAGYILGGQAWLDKEVNTVGTIKSGKLTVDWDFTPPPPLEDLTFRPRITDRYLADFAALAS